MLVPYDSVEEVQQNGGLSNLYTTQLQQALTTFGGTAPTDVAAAPPPVLNNTLPPGSYTEQQRAAYLNSPMAPSFFSPMSPQEHSIMAAWEAKYGGSGGGQTGIGGGSTGSTGGSNTSGGGTTGGIPERPSFFSPMAPWMLAEQQAWDAKYGSSPLSIGPPTSGPWQPPDSGGGTGTGYTPPGGGYTPPGGGYGNPGGGNTGAGNRPLYDYTYYRYNDGSKHLDEVNQQQGTGNEWGQMKNAWAMPTR